MTCTEWDLAIETRDLPPTSDGWRCLAPTGRASFSCSCGAAFQGRRDVVDVVAYPHMTRSWRCSHA